jgi:uncharacterized membrane protein YfcA
VYNQEGIGGIIVNLLTKLLIVCPLLFFAGVIDGISGGGGIISLPAYLMTGMPLNLAYGCNKMQSFLGTSASLFKYAKSGLVDFRPALIACTTAIVGSMVSTKIMFCLSEDVKKIIVFVAMIFIITLTLLSSRIKLAGKEMKRLTLTPSKVVLCLVCGLLLGLYDGFFGPGCGTIALMLFSILFGYDMCVATGNGKIIIVVSNLIALISYIAKGSIMYEIAIPASFANILGSYLGAHMAVKNGKRLVRWVLYLVSIVLTVQAILKMI